MQNSEAGIPLLTEVLQSPVYGIDLPERRSVPRESEPAPANFSATPPVQPESIAAPEPDIAVTPDPRAESVPLADFTNETRRNAGPDASPTSAETERPEETVATAPPAWKWGMPNMAIAQPFVEPLPPAAAPAADLPVASAGPDAAALARIERDVSKAVLDKLLSRVDEVLEAQIRDRLADVLQTAVDGLACDLRAGLKQALGESVSLAVAAELAAMQDSKIENSN